MGKRKKEIPEIKIDEIDAAKIRLIDRDYKPIGDFNLKTLSKKLW